MTAAARNLSPRSSSSAFGPGPLSFSTPPQRPRLLVTLYPCCQQQERRLVFGRPSLLLHLHPREERAEPVRHPSAPVITVHDTGAARRRRNEYLESCRRWADRTIYMLGLVRSRISSTYRPSPAQQSQIFLRGTDWPIPEFTHSFLGLPSCFSGHFRGPPGQPQPPQSGILGTDNRPRVLF